MKTLLKYITLIIATILLAGMADSCKLSTRNNNPSNDKAPFSSAVKTSNECDFSLWAHVYNPSRLSILDTCKQVSGTITESNADEDGDQHMLLKLDPGQENLLTNDNRYRKNGCLVIEAVCINNITRSKVGDACEGYVNNVDLPRLNDHVNVTGSYVIDTHNGWAEIHPITKVTLIK